MELIFRYPGIVPFSIYEKNVFYGRDHDIEQLFNLITNNKQVLLYSKSGLGKSSLINAGLLPKLQDAGQNGFHKVRFSYFQQYQHTYIQPHLATGYSIFAPLIAQRQKRKIPDKVLKREERISDKCLDKIIPLENSIWYFAKKWQSRMADGKILYLIFDQFEELFSYLPEDIFVFKKQLAELLYRDIPVNFRKVMGVKLKKQPDLLTEQEIDWILKPLDVRVLFSIRDDRMSQMKQLSDYLPDILRITHELKPLKREQARMAIE